MISELARCSLRVTACPLADLLFQRPFTPGASQAKESPPPTPRLLPAGAKVAGWVFSFDSPTGILRLSHGALEESLSRRDVTPLNWVGAKTVGRGTIPQSSNTSKLRTTKPPAPSHEDGGGTCFAESLYTRWLIRQPPYPSPPHSRSLRARNARSDLISVSSSALRKWPAAAGRLCRRDSNSPSTAYVR